MREINNKLPNTNHIQEHLLQVRRLLAKHALAETETHSQENRQQDQNGLVAKLMHKRQSRELREKLAGLRSGEIALILEALPLEQRLLVWDLVKVENGGEILLGVFDAVRECLISSMGHEELLVMTKPLPINGLAELSSCLPQAVMRDVFKSRSISEREQLRAAISHPKNEVGARIEFDVVTIRDNVTLEGVFRYLRLFKKLPDHTDQLFVVDRDGLFKGRLSLNTLLVNKPGAQVSTLMEIETLKLHPEDDFNEVAQTFKRYALISAPVVDEDGKLVGRITVSKVLEYIHSRSTSELLQQSGLQREEDLFSSVWESIQNRGVWLALNLCTVFIAARVISSFESSIEKLVALAILMSIVPALASQSASQTTSIMQRALANEVMKQLHAKELIFKEFSIAGLNGLVWGGMAGAFAYAMYKNVLLSLVTTSAVLLSFLLGSLAGVMIPLVLKRIGRDSVSGCALIITLITYSGSLFIFLGLATLLLIHP